MAGISFMSQEHQKALRTARGDLIKFMNPDSVIDALYAKCTISMKQKEELDALNTRSKKVGTLLDFIVKRPDSAYQELIDVLEEHEQSHVAEALRKALVTSDSDKDKPPSPFGGYGTQVDDEEMDKAMLTPRKPAPKNLDDLAAKMDDCDLQPTKGPRAFQPKNISQTPEEQSAEQSSDTIKSKTSLSHSLKTYDKGSSPGLAVMVTFTKFTGQNALLGVKQDIDKMGELWSDTFGFDFITWENKSKQEIERLLSKLIAKGICSRDKFFPLDIYGCFVLILSSHGEEGIILDHKKQQMKLKSIYEMFNNLRCKVLKGIPKLFFVDACRGDQTDFVAKHDSVETDETKVIQEQLPTYSDMLKAYATSPGYKGYCFRSGSSFLDSVYTIFKDCHQEYDVAHMMAMVIDHVYSKVWAKEKEYGDEEEQLNIQGPVWESSLRKKLELKSRQAEA